MGRPNVGKSSLLNALVGFDRCLVTDVAGTTRDTVEEKVLVGGVLLRLIDTAGIRDTADAVERLGVERSRAALAGAELALAVVDGPLTEEDTEILREAARCPKWILVWSKADLGGEAEPLPEGLVPDGTVSLSSRTGEGLSDLEAAVAALYPMGSVPAGQMLTNPRQAQAVDRAAEALRGALEALDGGLTPDAALTDTEAALGALGELTGKKVREDLVTQIFSRFCVGK